MFFFYPPTDNLNNALGAIRVLGLELIEDELKPHLNTVLTNIKERSELIHLISERYLFLSCAAPQAAARHPKYIMCDVGASGFNL